MATVRGYPLVVEQVNGPRYVAGLYQTTCGGFLFPATHAAGDQAPATLRLTGNAGLLLILLQTIPQLATLCGADAFFGIQPEASTKKAAELPLRPGSGACCHCGSHDAPSA